MSVSIRTTFVAGAFGVLCALTATLAAGAAGRAPVIISNPASNSSNSAGTSNFDPGIITSGQGTVTRRPDMAFIGVGVESHAATATDAQRGLATQAAKLISRAKSLGIADKDIVTEGYSIGPNYTPDGAINSYTAVEQLQLKWHNVDTTGSALDALVRQGGATRIGVSFGLADPKTAESDARALAVGDARSKAAVMAGAAGVKLGSVLRISDFTNGLMSPIRSFAPGAADTSTQVPVGELTVTVTVEVDFGLG